jgi:signal peptide peptidase SppA
VPAIPAHDTAVVDTAWDGPANERRLSNDAGRATYQRMYAWRDPDADVDTKAAYKLPHHEVDGNGRVGAANLAGARNALARLPQADIPAADHDAVRKHLNRHLDKGRSSSEEAPERIAGWLGEIDGRVWAVRPETLATLSALHHSGASLATARQAVAGPPRQRESQIVGGVAHVPLHGVLMPQASLLAQLLGLGGGLPAFRAELRAALADPEIGAVVLDVDSPGGLVDLIPETAAEIRNARGSKPIIAVASTMAASAAYWLASQADEIVVTPSGEVGSIGVYATHRDVSRMYDAGGITTTLVSAGKFKIEGNPYEPLGDDARAALQRTIDDFYEMFVRDVAAGRSARASEVRAGYGQGRALTARRAVHEGLADRVGTLEETTVRLARKRGSVRAMDEIEALAEIPEQDGAEAQAEIPEQDGAEAQAGATSEVTYSADERRRLVDAL